MKKASLLSAALLVASTFLGCTATLDLDENVPPPGADINWNTENSGTLEITNGSNKDIVLFSGQTPGGQSSRLLGGIRAGATKLFDVSDDVSDFSVGGYIILRGVSLEQYEENKSNLGQAKIDYSAMATYKAGQKYRLDINPSNMGEFGFVVNNNSPFGIELRKNSSQGEKVAYLAAGEQKVYVYADKGAAITLYTTFVYFNKSTAEVTTITSTDIYETLEATPRPLTNASSIQTYSVPVSKSAWNDIIGNLTVPYAYITVQNNLPRACLFTIGGYSNQLSQNGYDAVAIGERSVFQIEASTDGTPINFVINTFSGDILIPVRYDENKRDEDGEKDGDGNYPFYDPEVVPIIKNAYDYDVSVEFLGGDPREKDNYKATIYPRTKRDLRDMIESL